MNKNPSLNLYTAQQVQEMDRVTIQELKIPGYTLMNRAGAAALKVIRKIRPKAKKIAIFVARAIMAGTDLFLARLAKAKKMLPSVYLIGEESKIKGDARKGLEDLKKKRVAIQQLSYADIQAQLLKTKPDVIVDALFGTGLDRPIAGEVADLLSLLNDSQIPILSLGVPSGLNASTGSILGSAIRATATITFIANKQGFYTADGPDHCGQIILDDLQIGALARRSLGEGESKILPNSLILQPKSLKPRHKNAHKTEFGHVLVIGGNYGMSGAVRLCAEAALRVGAGLVSVATRAAHASFIFLTRPEIMSHAVESLEELKPLLEKATAIAIGPGLGQDIWAQEMLKASLAAELPLVVDADALNLLAKNLFSKEILKITFPGWTLTPHPGEGGRLLGLPAQRVQQDRFQAARDLAEKFQAVLVLKGCGTLIVDEQNNTFICPEGNPGMASAGMGDVLTGVIAGLVAQGLSLAEAAKLGVSVHAKAGDKAAQVKGERGLLASDLFEFLRELVN